MQCGLGGSDARGVPSRRRIGADRLPGVDPVASTLPAIGGQRDDPATTRPHGLPVDGHPRAVQLGERAGQRVEVGTTSAQRCDHDRRRAVAGCCGKCADDGATQHRMWAQLDEGVATPVGEHTDGIGEAHRLDDVPRPVRGVERRAIDRFAGDGRDHPNVSRRGGQTGERRLQRAAARRHLCTVERVGDGERPDRGARGLHHARGVCHGAGLAGDDGDIGCIDGGDRHPAPNGAINSATSAAGSSIDAIAPVPNVSRIDEPRSATTRMASST